MRNLNVVANDFASFASDFVDYIDDFNPDERLPMDIAQTVGTVVVPPLLRSLENQGLRALVGHDLRSVAKLQHASDGRMKRIIQTNDPRYHPNATPNDTMVLALMDGTKPQGCVASRLLWCERSLAEEMESGQLWVSHPATMWTSADRCIVRAPIAKTIRGCHIVFTGSIYLAQKVTGGSTLAAMLRLHYIWVTCHWRWSWLTGIIEGALARRHIFDVYGMAAMDIGVWRTRPGEGDEVFKYELPTCDRETAIENWLRPETGDLSRSLGRPPISVLPVEGHRADAD